MTSNTALDTVIGLRCAAFELLEATAHGDPARAPLAEAVDHLQIVANELGMVERLLYDQRPTPLPGELRRRRYWARAQYGHGRFA